MNFCKQNNIVGMLTLVLLVIPTVSLTMIHTPENALAIMRKQGNVYNGPLFEDDLLTPQNYLNRFWQQKQQASKEEKTIALRYVQEAAYLLPWAEERRHIAAGFTLGAETSYELYIKAIQKDDIPLTKLFLDLGVRAENKPSRMAHKPIKYAVSVSMARFLKSRGAVSPKNIAYLMIPGFSPDLLLEYSDRADFNKTLLLKFENWFTWYAPAFQALLLLADSQAQKPFEVLKKAALLRQLGVDTVNGRILIKTGVIEGEFYDKYEEALLKLIEKADSREDEDGIAIKKVFEALLDFVRNPKSYQQIFLQEAGYATSFQLVHKRELGARLL